MREKHPVVYGYGKKPVIYRSQSGPLLGVGEASGPFGEADKEKQKYVVLRYPDVDGVCLSGIVKGEKKIRGKAAIVHVPVGKGHVLLFTFNPFWRDLSHGNYMFVLNALLNYNDLGVGMEAPAPTEQ